MLPHQPDRLGAARRGGLPGFRLKFSVRSFRVGLAVLGRDGHQAVKFSLDLAIHERPVSPGGALASAAQVVCPFTPSLHPDHPLP